MLLEIMITRSRGPSLEILWDIASKPYQWQIKGAAASPFPNRGRKPTARPAAVRGRHATVFPCRSISLPLLKIIDPPLSPLLAVPLVGLLYCD